MAYPQSWQCPSCSSAVYNSVKCTTCNYQPPSESGSLSLKQVSTNGYPILKDRLIAFLIDAGILFALALVISLSAGFLLSGSINKGFDVIMLSFGIPIILVFIAFHPVYFMVMEGIYKQTYGKKAMGLRVVSDEGMSFTKSLVRNALRFIEAIPLYIPSILMIRKNGQRLGDKIAKTRVVKKA